MSFLPLNNQENKYAPEGQTTPSPAAEAPPQTGGSVGDEGGGPKGSASGSPTQFGSSASKLGDYLSANAPQVTAQADKLAGNLNTQFGQLQGGIQNAASQFGQQVQGGYVAPNQEVVGQAMQNPTQFAMNPDSVKAFQAQYNNQYTGPQNFEGSQGYGAIQGQVGSAVQQGNLLGTQAGLQSYLQGQGKGSNPTAASSTLDALLMRGNPEAQAKIQQAAGQFGGLTGQLESAKTAGNQSVQAAQKAAEDSRAYAQGQFNPYVQNFGETLNQNLANAQTQYGQYNQGVSDLRGQLQGIQSLYGGLQGIYGDQLSQNPLSAYFSSVQPLNQAPTLENVATPEQFSNEAAINQLLGYDVSPLNQEFANQAGGFQSGTPLPNIADISSQVGQSFIDQLFKQGRVTTNEDLAKYHQAKPTQEALRNLLMQYGGTFEQGYI